MSSECKRHHVRTVQEQGWSGLKNGDLLQRAGDGGFEVFVTADQNLEFQHNLARSRLGVVVLVAPSIALEDIRPLVPAALLAIVGWSELGRLLASYEGWHVRIEIRDP